MTRDEFVLNVETIFGNIDKFFDIITEDLPYRYSLARDEEEIYLIDTKIHKYIHWYKLTHLGRDFHTDLTCDYEISLFLQTLFDEYNRMIELEKE